MISYVLVFITLSLITIWLMMKGDRTTIDNTLLIQRNRRIERLWTLTQQDLREGNYLKAEQALLTILKLDQKNTAAFNRLGIIYAKQKEYDDAKQCFTAAYHLNKNVSSLHNLGLVYFQLEQYEKASIAFKQALKMDNQSSVRYLEYAKTLERLGKDKESLEALEKAAQLDTGKPEVLNLLLKAYENRLMPQKAKKIREQLKSLSIS